MHTLTPLDQNKEIYEDHNDDNDQQTMIMMMTKQKEDNIDDEDDEVDDEMTDFELAHISQDVALVGLS